MFRTLFRLIGRPPAVEQDIEAELRFHFEAETERLVARGMDPKAARVEAERRFGSLPETRRTLMLMDRQRRGRERRIGWMEELRQDLAYAFRGIRRQPAFAILVVTTLALGIGANATMFGIVDRTLLRPPAFLEQPGRTGRVYLRSPAEEGGERIDLNLTYPTYLDLKNGSRTMSAAAAFYDGQRVVGIGEHARPARVSLVSASFWTMFGIRPELGRFFSEAEDQTPSGTAVAVLGYGHWQSAFGGDPEVLGKSLFVGFRNYTIICVAPAGFQGMSLRQVGIFIPITAGAFDELGERYYRTRFLSFLEMIGRTGPGISRQQVDAELTVVYRRMLTDQNTAPARVSASRVELASALLERGPVGSQNSKVAVWLAGVAVIVLVIACANVANLLLSRSLRRRRETAVRLALGVGKRRLLRQLLTESTVFALAGSGAALVLAYFGSRALGRAMMSEVDWTTTSLFDPRILVFTLACGILTSVLTGTIPSLQAGRTDVSTSLKSGGREGHRTTARVRSTLLVVQAALSVVLLVGSGLFVRSLRNVNAVDMGYEPGRIVHVTKDFRGTSLTGPEREALQERMRATAAAMPGVQSVAATWAVPFWGSDVEPIFIPGRDSVNQLGPFYLNRVSGRYFETSGTPILRGRPLTEADRASGGSRRQVAVISESMARRLWPGEDAIGRCFQVDADTMPCSEIVGIAKDVRWGSLGDADRMQHYHPLPTDGRGALYVRTDGDPGRLVEPLRRELQRLMPGNAYVTTRPLASTLDYVVRPWRLGATMFTLFGGLAVVVAAIGLYGVIAYSVTQRLHEMGVRIALGARTSDLLRLVLTEGIRVTLIGIVIGAAVALAVGRFLVPLLFGVSASDPATFLTVGAILLLVAAVASLLPALRAAGVNPNQVLRAE